MMNDTVMIISLCKLLTQFTTVSGFWKMLEDGPLLKKQADFSLDSTLLSAFGT